MPLMTWTDKMSVGVEVLDNDHKKLVALVNQLFDGIQAGHGKDAVGQVLDGLISYTVEHFKREEEFFAKTGYPETAEHKKLHEDLTRQVLDVQQKYKSGAGATLSLEVMNFLKNWLINHIQGSDKRYTAHLNANGIK